MAKKKAATPQRWESVGWTFFVVLTVILCFPGALIAWLISYDRTEWYTRIGMGMVFAALASAVLTWMTNSALQYRASRAKKAQRKRGKRK